MNIIVIIEVVRKNLVYNETSFNDTFVKILGYADIEHDLEFFTVLRSLRIDIVSHTGMIADTSRIKVKLPLIVRFIL